MYHYVQKANRDLPYFRYLDFDNFRKQLDFFSKNYLFATRDEWDQLISGNLNDDHEKKIILTFDDSLSCHYDYVSKELENGYSNFIILGDWNDDLRDLPGEHSFQSFFDDDKSPYSQS